jgi:hypothetical protein
LINFGHAHARKAEFFMEYVYDEVSAMQARANVFAAQSLEIEADIEHAA